MRSVHDFLAAEIPYVQPKGFGLTTQFPSFYVDTLGFGFITAKLIVGKSCHNRRFANLSPLPTIMSFPSLSRHFSFGFSRAGSSASVDGRGFGGRIWIGPRPGRGVELN